MERTQQNKKRRWRIRQYRSLSLYVVLCLFCIEGQTVEKANLSKQNSKTQLKIQKNTQKTRQIASKKVSKTKKTADKAKVVETLSTKKSSLKKTSQKTAGPKRAGYKISHIKTGDIFGKMKLKKRDTILSIDGKSVNSKKQIHQILSLAGKKQKNFSVFITRNKQDFLISYKIAPFKTKRKMFISNVQRIKDKIPVVEQRRGIATSKIKESSKTKKPSVKASPAKAKNKKSSKTKKTIVPEKYRTHLQSAYVVAMNSFIYEKPDFDSPQLYPLSIGEKILISKKIFRPSHNFGSFYKILLIRPKKVVGYISEAEVVPEFIKQNNKYEANTIYKIAKKQMKEDRALDIDLIDKVNSQKQKNPQKITTPKNNKKRYVGLSVGFLAYPPPVHFEENILAGLKLSGYNLLIPSINIDFNFTFTPYDFKFFHFDILSSYPLLKFGSSHFFIMGGLKLDIDHRIQDPEKQINPGVAGVLALLIPIGQKLLFRLDAKAEYGLAQRPNHQAFSSSFSSSLQIAF